MPYLNVEEAESALANLAAAYPDLCTLIPLPNLTVEGRTCTALQIGPTNRDTFMLVGGLHAREWGSCDILISFAADLLEAYSTSADLAYGGSAYSLAQVQQVMDGMTLVIFPQVNPDGKNFSQTVNPDWRRNRNPAESGGNPSCIGVDINRNFDFLWDYPTQFSASSRAVVSTNPCDTGQTYHGSAPFSEAESQNVRWLLDQYPRTRWFFDVHCYAGFVLTNFADDETQTVDPAQNFRNVAFDGQRGVAGDGYAEYVPASDRDAMRALGNQARNAIESVRGQVYVTKSFFDMYPAPGTSADYAASRHLVDPTKGKIYGYTLEWGQAGQNGGFQPPFEDMEQIIVDVSSGLLSFTLGTFCNAGVSVVEAPNRALRFNDVPEGEITSRAAVFEVESCAAVTLRIVDGPLRLSGSGAFSQPVADDVVLPAASTAQRREARVWVSWQAGTEGTSATGRVTIRHVESNRDFEFSLEGNAIHRPTVASILVLDQSGSMQLASGLPGQTRVEVLRDAAPIFVELLANPDAVGIVRFDQDSHDALPVTVANAGGRAALLAAIAGHNPNPGGQTSIGDGVFRAREILQASPGFDSQAIVVFTDGFENQPRYLADIAASINSRVFAIGLGTADFINPIALNAIANGTGGYLLMTGDLSGDDRFRLSKYFLQILAGVTNAEVVLDPEGALRPGDERSVPFLVTRADTRLDAILLTPGASAIRFDLEGPSGAVVVPAGRYRRAAAVAFYRTELPYLADHEGHWTVKLRIDGRRYRQLLDDLMKQGRKREVEWIDRFGIPFSLAIQTRSALRLKVDFQWNGTSPTSRLTLVASLSEAGIPLTNASVSAEITFPQSGLRSVALAASGPGRYSVTVPGRGYGPYPIRFLASGRTLRGVPFTREQLRTAALWRTAGNSPPRGKRPGRKQDG